MGQVLELVPAVPRWEYTLDADPYCMFSFSLDHCWDFSSQIFKIVPNMSLKELSAHYRDGVVWECYKRILLNCMSPGLQSPPSFWHGRSLKTISTLPTAACLTGWANWEKDHRYKTRPRRWEKPKDDKPSLQNSSQGMMPKQPDQSLSAVKDATIAQKHTYNPTKLVKTMISMIKAAVPWACSTPLTWRLQGLATDGDARCFFIHSIISISM